MENDLSMIVRRKSLNDYLKTTKTRLSLPTTVIFWIAIITIGTGLLFNIQILIQTAIISWLIFGSMMLYEIFRDLHRERKAKKHV